jgi:hypothetical protein
MIPARHIPNGTAAKPLASVDAAGMAFPRHHRQYVATKTPEVVDLVLQRQRRVSVSLWPRDCTFAKWSEGEKLMTMQHKIAASLGVVLLAATASFAQQVKTDYDRSADFSQYKTYSWEKVQTQNPLWVDRIKEAVDTALSAKGWTQVPSGGSVAIVAIEMTKNQQTLNTFYNGFGGGWRWGGGFGGSTTTVDNYRIGTLVVDLFDANSKKLIWRGSSSDTLSSKSDKNIKELDKGVEKMFDHFPPSETK